MFQGYRAMLAVSGRLAATGLALSLGATLWLSSGGKAAAGAPFAAFALAAVLVATLQQTLP